MTVFFFGKRFKFLVSVFVVFAMLANVAAPAFADTQPAPAGVKKPTLSGWDVLKGAAFGAVAGFGLGSLLGSGSTIYIASLALPGAIIPALIGAVVIGGIMYFIKKTTDGVKEGAVDPRNEQLERIQREQGGGLLGTPMQESGVGGR